MVYRRNPVNLKSRSKSCGPIQQNFSDYSNTFNVNHLDINDANAGKHFKVEMLNQSSEPTPKNTDITLFSSSSEVVTGQTQPIFNSKILSYSYLIGGNPARFFMLEGLIFSKKITDIFTNSTEGWFRSENGALIKYGFFSKTANLVSSSYTFTYRTSRSIPVFTKDPCVIACLMDSTTEDPSSISVDITSSKTDFTIYTKHSDSNGDVNVLYLAIGE